MDKKAKIIVGVWVGTMVASLTLGAAIFSYGVYDIMKREEEAGRRERERACSEN